MLLKGANPNAITSTPLVPDFPEDDGTDETPAFAQTPLHVAIVNRHKDVVQVFLNYKGWYAMASYKIALMSLLGQREIG